jgi:hypothetical protein
MRLLQPLLLLPLLLLLLLLPLLLLLLLLPLPLLLLLLILSIMLLLFGLATKQPRLEEMFSRLSSVYPGRLDTDGSTTRAYYCPSTRPSLITFLCSPQKLEKL